MRRYAALLAAAVLVVAACGDDDTGSTATTSGAIPTVAPANTEPSATTGAPATTAASAATTAAPAAPTSPPESVPATTGSPEDAARQMRIAGAALLAGDWSGQWNNTTYGSSGSIDVSVEVNTDAGFLLATIDLGGSVFGLEDPEPETIELDLVAGPPYELRSALLGKFTLDIEDDGSFTLTADDVAAQGIASMSITGSMGPSTFSGDYTIGFEGGGGAEGTIEATKTG